jgi:hypothetical protein
VATQRAVMNFSELARRENLSQPEPLSKDGPISESLTMLTAASVSGPTLSPPPASGFLALDSDGLRHPPDTMGAVGPEHVMTMLNSRVRIQDRAGNSLSTVTLSNFWGALGPFLVDATQTTHYGVVTWLFDPRLFFDATQQRWIACSLADGPTLGESRLLIGVSRTSDPTGDWFLYRFEVDPTRIGWWGRVVPPEDVSITGVTVGEPSRGTTQAVLRASLSRSNMEPVSVDFVASDGGAVSGSDYVSAGGTVVFAPGETIQTVTVPLLDDPTDESNEVFFVNLGNPTNTALAFSQGVVTILDNDPPPSLTIDDVTVREGDAGFTDATFTFSLSIPSGLPVSFRALTANAGATLRVDYLPTNITVTIPPGASQRTHAIQIIGDTLIETNETFFLNLSSPTNVTIARSRGTATIVDDDFRVTAVEFVGGDVRLSFSTEAGKTYRVERTASLSSPVTWEPLPGAGSVPGTGAPVVALDPGALTQPQRFYRIVLP